MLTKRQNMIETMKVGGHPDRFVNGYEALGLVMGSPFGKRNPNPKPGELNVVNAWGITKSWPKGTPGAFPVHVSGTHPRQDRHQGHRGVAEVCEGAPRQVRRRGMGALHRDV